MMPRSIRFRLSAWYFAALTLALLAFGIGTWLTMRMSLHDTVDDSLRNRFDGVREFMEAHIDARSLEANRHEFSEHSVLRPGGDIYQVCDSQGNWLYRSGALATNDVKITLPSKLPPRGRFENLEVQQTPLREYSAPAQVHGQFYTIQIAEPVEEVAEALAKYRFALFLLIPTVLALASGGGYWMSRRALAPVDRIIHDAQSVSSQSLQKRLDVPQTNDELQRLSETLNQMLQRLELAFQRITQFTADASHELRTPIAVIRTTAELALRRLRSSADYESALRDILLQSERTTELIDNLLTLARADTGKSDLHLIPTDLSKAISEAVETGRKLAETKGIEFSDSTMNGNIMVKGDAQAFTRLALILIDNAVKYTPSPGSVSLRLASSGGFAVFEVSDTGIGISPHDLPHIFERFYRADPARGNKGGAGLGLAIAHWIAQQHGGEIKVESTSGSGSKISVFIPLADGDSGTASSSAEKRL
jgi:heavy metal sensor kinase